MDSKEEQRRAGDEEFRKKVDEIPGYSSSLDRATAVRSHLADNGVDLLKPCSAGEGESCWLVDCIPTCNKLLNSGALQITSNRKGGIDFVSIDSYLPEDADLFPAHFLRDWLLTYHRCFHVILDVDLQECHLSDEVRKLHLSRCSQRLGIEWPTSPYLEFFKSPGDFPAEVAPDLREIRALNFFFSYLGSSGASRVASLIESTDTLQEIDISSNDLGDEGFVAIADALLQNRSVRKLSIAQNELTSTAILKIADVLTVNTTLEYVDIGEIDLSGPVCNVLFEEKKYAGLFKKVRVFWTQDRLEQLAAILRRDDHMASLSLVIGPDVPSPALDALFDALESNKTVTDISFHLNGDIFDALTDRLVHLLQTTDTIRQCHIHAGHDNKDGETHLIKILGSLEHNKSVFDFSMYAEFVTPPLAFAIGKLLEANDVLNGLSLCEYWSIDTEDIRTMARGLDRNYTLLRLQILGDFDFIDGMPEIWEALRRNQSLLYPASRFAAGESTDQVSQEAFRKVRRSKALVEEVATLTGKCEEEARQIVEAAWDRMNCSV